MDAIIGLSGIGLVIFVTPISLLILIIKLLMKKPIKRDIIRTIIILVAGIILFFVGALMPSDVEYNEDEIKSTTEASNEITETSTEKKTEATTEKATTKTETTTEATTEKVEEKTTAAQKEELTDFVKDLKKFTSKKVANKAYKILREKIGFKKVTYVGKNSVGDSNWNIKADGYELVLTASDDVYRIFIPNSSYTFYEDGKVKMTKKEFKDRIIDHNDKSAYYIIAEEIITNCLKNPGTAEFPSIVTKPGEIAMQKKGNIIAVQSYVDAVNSFGSYVRSEWTVQYKVIDLDTFSYELIYVNIDGESSGKFKDMD